jgi:hypothetical protein
VARWIYVESSCDAGRCDYRAQGPEVLQVQERPDPPVGPGEVRIAVKAAGINFARHACPNREVPGLAEGALRCRL